MPLVSSEIQKKGQKYSMQVTCTFLQQRISPEIISNICFPYIWKTVFPHMCNGRFRRENGNQITTKQRNSLSYSHLISVRRSCLQDCMYFNVKWATQRLCSRNKMQMRIKVNITDLKQDHIYICVNQTLMEIIFLRFLI